MHTLNFLSKIELNLIIERDSGFFLFVRLIGSWLYHFIQFTIAVWFDFTRVQLKICKQRTRKNYQFSTYPVTLFWILIRQYLNNDCLDKYGINSR